ncbi:unnamed protein product, partial [Ectocarpus sp. 12 AP-2014]
MLSKGKSGAGASASPPAKRAKTPPKATKKRKAAEVEEEEEEEDEEEEEREEEEAPGPTTDELRAKVEELIANSEDVSSLTFKMMKGQLEEHFGIPLADRKPELI